MKIVPGIYRHYKGNKYRVIAVAKNSDTLEDFVYYESLYENPLSHFWVRPASEWFDEIEHHGRKMLRYTLIETADSSE